MRIKFVVLIVTFGISVFHSTAMATGEFGLIVDTKGKPTIKRGSSAIEAEFGKEVLLGDTLQTNKDDKVVLVAYKSCDEWTIPALSQVRINNESNLYAGSSQLTPSNQLPVCYRPESFALAGLNIVGGTVLRGGGNTANDAAMDKLQQSADIGHASSSELMSLIIFNLNQGKQKQAQKYYAQLLNQNPEAKVPSSLEEKLKAK